MEVEKNDAQTEDDLRDLQENYGKLDEPAKERQSAEKIDEPAKAQQKAEKHDEPEVFQQNAEKHDEPGGIQQNKEVPEMTPQSNEKLDAHEVGQQCREQLEGIQHDKEKPDTPPLTENIDVPEVTQQQKEKLDEPEGTWKKKKWTFKKKKKNLNNGNVDQNNLNNVHKVIRVEEKVVVAEGTVQKKGKLLKFVEAQQNNDEPEASEHGKMKDKNNCETSKVVKNKQIGKKIRGSAGIKIGKLNENVGEASGFLTNEKMKDQLGMHIGGAGGVMKNEKMEDKLEVPNKGRKPDRTKDKLGGLIFMCSPKTKPDCFRYSVMGVSMSKKDLVQRIKPGLKLFLYDFDLKLLYGIYKASSSGGMKLEPAAFGGAFPAQVRFEVHRDCNPIPESVFKKAIKENYNEKQKFKIELTIEQVKKLSSLFRPAAVGSNASVRSSSTKRGKDPKVYRAARENQPPLSRTRSDRDHTYGNSSREEYHPESFLSEKEYRIYGLLGRRRSRSPPRYVSSNLVPHYEREVHPRYPVTGYRDATSPRVTSVHRDLALPNGRDERDRPYSHGSRQELPSSPVRREPALLDERRYRTRDPVSQLDLPPHQHLSLRHYSALDSNQPYYSYLADPYRPAIRRDEILASGPYYTLDGRRVVYLPEADPLQRREQEVLPFASSALSDYNQGYVFQEASRQDPAFAPVSSRYSFAGPSSYR